MSSCHVVNLWGHEQPAQYELLDQRLYLKLQDEELVIPLKSLSGLDLQFLPGSPFLILILETTRKLRGWMTPHYLRLKISYRQLADDFTPEHHHLQPYRHLIQEGLPSWSYRVPYLTPSYRRLTQLAILGAEIMIFLWTLYQILYQTPGFWSLLQEMLPLKALSLVFWPVTYLISYLRNWIAMAGQFLVIYTIYFEQLYGWIQPIFQFLGGMLRFVGSILMLPFTLWRKTPSFPETPGLNWRQWIWQTLIRPINYLYTLIRTPQTGEIGRKISTLKGLSDPQMSTQMITQSPPSRSPEQFSSLSRLEDQILEHQESKKHPEDETSDSSPHPDLSHSKQD